MRACVVACLCPPLLSSPPSPPIPSFPFSSLPLPSLSFSLRSQHGAAALHAPPRVPSGVLRGGLCSEGRIRGHLQVTDVGKGRKGEEGGGRDECRANHANRTASGTCVRIAHDNSCEIKGPYSYLAMASPCATLHPPLPLPLALPFPFFPPLIWWWCDLGGRMRCESDEGQKKGRGGRAIDRGQVS